MNTSTNEIINFMGGKSFKLFNPLKRAELVAFSSFLGEPTYYQPVDKIEYNTLENEMFQILKDHLLIPTDFMISRNETFYKAINNSLDFDFKKTL